MKYGALLPLGPGNWHGARKTFLRTLTIPADVATGSYFIGAYADIKDMTPELSECNNANSTELTMAL